MPLGALFWESITTGDEPLGNYRELWGSVLLGRAIRVTLELGVVTTLICLVVGFAVAYRLTLMRPARAHLVLLVILFPVWTAVLARLYAWTIVLGRRGPINDWLVKSGLLEEPMDLVFNRSAAVIGLVHILLPYMVVVLYATLSNVDGTLVDVARSLGAGRLTVLRRVLLPLTMPGVVAGCLLVFVLAIGNYVTPEILGGRLEYTVPQEVVRLAVGARYGQALAVGFVLLVAVAVVVLVVARLVGFSRLVGGGVRR